MALKPVYERMKDLDRAHKAGESVEGLLRQLLALLDELANVPASEKYVAAALDYGKQLRARLES